MSLVSLFTATRGRLQGDDARAVVAALLDKPLDDEIVSALVVIFGIARAKANISAIPLLELALAQAGDLEKISPVNDITLQSVANWMVTQGLGNFPQPFPRRLLLPLAIALVAENQKDNLSSATSFLQSTYKFDS